MDPQTQAPKAPEAPKAPAVNQESVVAGAPETWPGAFGVYKHSKSAVMLNLGPYLLIILIAVLGGALPYGIDNQNVGNVVSWLVNAFTLGASAYLFLAGIRGKKVATGDVLSTGVHYFLKMLGLSILTFLALALSLIALIIPFFFVLPRLMLANYHLVDKDMGIVDALKASWEETKGHSLKVWGIIGVNILMILLMVTIIGIPIALYLLVMYGAAFAVLYAYINNKQPATT